MTPPLSRRGQRGWLSGAPCIAETGGGGPRSWLVVVNGPWCLGAPGRAHGLGAAARVDPVGGWLGSAGASREASVATGRGARRAAGEVAMEYYKVIGLRSVLCQVVVFAQKSDKLRARTIVAEPVRRQPLAL